MTRKKTSKRSSSKPHPSMAYSQSPPFNYPKLCILIPILFICGVILPLVVSSNMWSKSSRSGHLPGIYTVEVLNEFHHDPGAFTQGLLYAGNDTLFESTGLNRKSSVRQVALKTGKVEVLQKMDDSYFGEGLTLLGERLFQVTWLTKTGFIYDRYDLKKFKMFTHQMQDGWGLATDGKVLFGSDGTSTLYQIDPQTLKVTEKHIVKYNGHEVHQLNELEYIDGEVWANVWMTDCIARISHKDGSVVGWILLPNLREGLVKAGNDGIDVLNGIAWDSENKRVFVTGKLWPKLYEIKLHPVKGQLKNGVIKQLCLRSDK